MALRRFVEYFEPDAALLQPTKAPITESQRKLVESKISNLRESLDIPEGKTVYRVPISRYDNMNGNGRKYEARLWQRVKEAQKEKYCGKIGLADHPEGNTDGSFKDSAVVWLDIELDESQKLVWGYCVPVGNYGKLFEEIIAANGLPGFSSSGFGELDTDGSTVRYDTYELERPADIVLTPSQDVYGDKSMVFTAPNGATIEVTPPEQPKADTPEVVITTSEPVAEPTDDIIAISDIVAPVQVATTDIPAPSNMPHHGKGFKVGDYQESKNRSTLMALSKLEERKLEKDITTFYEETKQEKNPIKKSGMLKDVLGFFDDIPAMTEKLVVVKEAIITDLDSVSADVHSMIEESLKIEEEIGIKSVEELKTGLSNLAETTLSFNESADHWKQVAETLQKNVNSLKAKLSSNPSIKEYEDIVRELERTDKATRNIVESQNTKITNVKKRLFDERNLSRKLEKECSELKIQLEASISAKKTFKDKAVAFKEAYLKVAKRNKQLVAEKKSIVSDVKDFLEGDLYKFGRSQKIVGSAAERIGKKVDFTQRQYVERYYLDLEKQYGDDIIPYKEQILSKKTYKEASSEFTRILGRMEEVHIPRSIQGAERVDLLREHGITIKDKSHKTKNAITNILNEFRNNG